MARDTLTFDQVALGEGAEQPVPDGYGGFAWSQAGVYNPADGDGLGYEPASGANLAFFAEAGGFEVPGYPGAPGDPVVLARADGGDFTLEGAAFSSANIDGLPITARAYDDGALVGEVTIDADRDALTAADFEALAGGDDRFASVDRVEFDAPRYFGFDDLAFATAETLTFDDLPLGEGDEQPIPDGYGGLNWTQAGAYNPREGDGLGYEPASGANTAFFAEAGGFDVTGYEGAPGDPLVVESAAGRDFSLERASFSSANIDGLEITARAYDDGALVGEFTVEADRDALTAVDFAAAAGERFASIDRLEFDAPRYFGVDDLTYIA